MNKFITIIKGVSLALLILFASSIFCQDGENKFGVKGAINISNFHSTTNDVDKQNLKLGFQGGLFYKLALTDFLAIQPELLYTTKGASYDYEINLITNGEITQKFGYIQVPVMAVVNLGETFSVHAGPYAAYLISADVKNESNNAVDFSKELEADDFERLEYGLSVGAGFEFDKLMFGARYDYGLSNTGKEQNFSLNGIDVPSTIFEGQKNSVLSLFLGLNF